MRRRYDKHKIPFRPRDVPCPQCQAPAGEPCTGRNGPRIQHHEPRWAAAKLLRRAENRRTP